MSAEEAARKKCRSLDITNPLCMASMEEEEMEQQSQNDNAMTMAVTVFARAATIALKALRTAAHVESQAASEQHSK